MTGSTPHYHGIIADKFYSLIDNNIVSCIDDARYEGINTNDMVSPRLLQATTLADQIKLSNSRSKVYSIALTAEAAIMLGGHLADGAIWFDNANASICTSTFYDKGLPRWAQKINRDGTMRSICSENWQPLFSMPSYQYAPQGSYNNNEKPKFLKFSNNDDNYDFMDKFRQSPFINEIINDLMIDFIIFLCSAWMCSNWVEYICVACASLECCNCFWTCSLNHSKIFC